MLHRRSDSKAWKSGDDEVSGNKAMTSMVETPQKDASAASMEEAMNDASAPSTHARLKHHSTEETNGQLSVCWDAVWDEMDEHCYSPCKTDPFPDMPGKIFKVCCDAKKVNEVKNCCRSDPEGKVRHHGSEAKVRQTKLSP